MRGLLASQVVPIRVIREGRNRSPRGVCYRVSMTQDPFSGSLSKLSRHCVSEAYKGYSLYDSHTSPIPFHRMGDAVSFYTNQVIKRSPINLRRLLGIKKGYNPKGVGLFLHALTDILEHDLPIQPSLIRDNVEEEATALFEWLLENPSSGYSGTCWGYNYPWPKRDVGLVPSFMPSSVVTGFNSRAIFNYYRFFGDERARATLASAVDFILNDIPRTESDEGLCFSYLPIERDRTINANLLAAEVLAYADHAHGTSEHESTIREVLAFTVNTQNAEGSWYYSFNMAGGAPKKQIDFHQGYVLESILRICTWSDIDYDEYRGVVNRGLDFYREKQFDSQGNGYWRYPTKWPVDIHNQSQGIITFSAFAHEDPHLLDFAEKIALHTVSTMQSGKGSFYYQRWPFLMNRVSYMRWNQAWMYVALVKLMVARQAAQRGDARTGESSSASEQA